MAFVGDQSFKARDGISSFGILYDEEGDVGEHTTKSRCIVVRKEAKLKSLEKIWKDFGRLSLALMLMTLIFFFFFNFLVS